MNHVGICILGESMPMESVRCLGAMLLDVMREPIPGLGFVSQHFFQSSILPYSRSKVIESAVKAGATHVLTIDADMVYPANGLRRLLAHERPLVVCNATTRRPPIRWVATDREKTPLDSNALTGLGKAWNAGIAFALMEARVYRAVRKPHFMFEYTENGFRGEDVYFCEGVRKAGFEVMMDHDLSREIGHVGSVVFHGGHVAVREAGERAE